MKKPWLSLLKLLILFAVIWIVGTKLRSAWLNVQQKQLAIDWRWSPIAILSLSANMLTSSLVWRWLAWRKGDRSPTLPLLGAYFFSQTGKYIPGKIGLLLMRVERAARFGMSPGICTMSTLLENILYLISGGLFGMLAIGKILDELRARDLITASQQRWQWPLIAALMLIMMFACHPAIFYGIINRGLRFAKKSPIPPEQRLPLAPILISIFAFIPCWLFGGIAIWASTRCVQNIAFTDSAWLAPAFALSVIIGMASLMPGGLGARELVVGSAVTLQLTPAIGHDPAFIAGTAAALLLRLFQVISEITMGAIGILLTRAKPLSASPQTSPH